ncbi:MAG TPA: GNAT family N-acetyltransferase [Actinomycetota bacterium]|nr:GNAT family N-acetyltransferase [Actinomycetota bacterium]
MLDGIAVWLPPGAFPWSAWRKLKATGPFLKVWAADPRSFRTFTRLGENSELNHPTDPHWSLEALGIRPEAQRRGLGSRLLQPVLERADSEGLPCYLETSDPANVAFYERFGFEVVRQVPLIPDGPPHVAMRRAAETSRPPERET